jgi:hypothetical protein
MLCLLFAERGKQKPKMARGLLPKRGTFAGCAKWDFYYYFG